MVLSATILRDTTFWIKDLIQDNITDPITRPAGQSFILTAYPQRAVTYPIITVKDLNTESTIPSGMQSEVFLNYQTFEIRIWARTIKEKNDLYDQIYDLFRINQIGTASESQAQNLHDLKFTSVVNIDEPGDGNPKSKIITIKYLYITQ